MLSKNVYSNGYGGYSYEITDEQKYIRLLQDYKAGMSGKILMTQSEADTEAQAFIDSFRYIVLTVDKPIITADGIDTAIITATVYDANDSIDTNRTNDIIFILDGQIFNATVSNGTASLTFNTVTTGEYYISTDNIATKNNGIKVVAQ